MASVTIKGFIGNQIFSKGDFRIYGFYPNNNDLNKVVLSSYGNITIKGELPDMLEGKEYEIEVEYEKKGKYESYNVVRILTNMSDMTHDETIKFLEDVVGEKIARGIVNVYPDFLQIMMDERYNEIDLSKLKGVKEHRFEKIKEKINSHIKFLDIMTHYSEYKLTISQVKRIYERYSSFELLKKKMDENPYHCLCSIGGIGFKTADTKILSNNRGLATSKFRMKECVMCTLLKNEESGHTWMHKGLLLKECANITPECMANFDKAILDPDVYYSDKNGYVARRTTYNCEGQVAILIKNLLENPIKWYFDIEKYKVANGFELTAQQQEILSLILDNNLCVLSGNAGTGKSMSCSALVQMLVDNEMSFKLFAPTGKASKVLNEYVGHEASTIHRGLKYNPSEGFEHDEKNPLSCDVVIVDEASMIDVYLMRDLLKAINPKRTKLVFVCDPAQIPSVGCGNCIQDIISSNIIPVASLNQVFRYKDGGLAKVATETREGNKFLDDKCETNQQVFGDNKDFIFISKDKEVMQQEVLRVYGKLLNNGIDKNDIVVLSAYNKGELGTYRLNSLIQDMVNPFQGKQVSYNRDKNEIKFRVGDRVMQTVNTYKVIDLNSLNEVDIFNGDEGIVTSVRDDSIMVEFGECKIHYSKEGVSDLLLSYSISMHKSQGSQYKHVIVVTPSAHKFFLNRNLLYVAYTRAKEKVYNIGTIDTINSSLRKSDNLSRQTFLRSMLENTEK